MKSGVATLCLLLAASSASAATLPVNFTESIIATGLLRPTAMALAPDGRLFVCEQGGNLRVITSGGALLSTPFVSLSVDSGGERGLIGVAFDPAFQTNQFVYVYYTVPPPNAHNRVSRFTANGNVAAANSETLVMALDTLGAAPLHNGGAIHFAPDGTLFVAVGDAANSGNAQSFGNRLGKMLRVNADGSIPANNPFFGSTSGANRSIWALGLRNPFTFAFGRWSGDLFINDVGAQTWEEINRGLAGANYGWPTVEGVGNNPNFHDPLFAYDHSTGCAISGGTFYSPLTPRFPTQYFGAYFFADFCGGWIRWRAAGTGVVSAFASAISGPVEVTSALDGRLYYLARGVGDDTGLVGRIDYTASTVLITANGNHGSVTLGPGQPLQLAIAFSSGNAVLNPAEIYVGVARQDGSTLWLDANTMTFGLTLAPVYSGPLGTFGPTLAVNIPDVSALAPGHQWWFVTIDHDSNGVPNATLLDYTKTIIQ
jgi:glucose/arabinose dehydrogenase